jgi:hypothetical protein
MSEQLIRLKQEVVTLASIYERIAESEDELERELYKLGHE